MVDAGLALLIIVIVFGAFLILRSIKNFIINAIVGLVILFGQCRCWAWHWL